jgi:hypothetical protein
MRVSQQIGWSQESKLIYNIIRQLNRLEIVWDDCCTTTSSTSSSTTTTTTTSTPIVPLSVCPGNGCANCESRITIYVSNTCFDNLGVGCSVWRNAEGTISFPDGFFHIPFAATFHVLSGVIDITEFC